MQSNSKKVFLFPDSKPEAGLGHITRCIGLGEILTGNFDVTLLVMHESEFIRSLAINSSLKILYIQPGYIAAHRLVQYDDIIVLDGYEFTSDDELEIKSEGAIVVTIDDLHNRKYFADAVINYVGGISKEKYQVSETTQLMLGPEYLILRRDYFSALNQRSQPYDPAKIFISMGGFDPRNFGKKISEILLRNFSGLDIHLVTGLMNPHLEELFDLEKRDPGLKIYTGLDATELINLQLSCGVAITTSSVASWEAAAIRIPLFIISAAPNQVETGEFFTSAGMADYFHSPEEITSLYEQLKSNPGKIEKMIRCQAEIVNEVSANNLVKLFKTL